MAKTVSFPVIDLKSTGGNIESCRREAGLSVRELQDYFGCEYPQAIYKWQHGECLPTVDNLLALSRILEVKMEGAVALSEGFNPERVRQAPFHIRITQKPDSTEPGFCCKIKLCD